MMMSSVLRRSSSMAARRTLAAASTTNSIDALLHHLLSPATPPTGPFAAKAGFTSVSTVPLFNLRAQDRPFLLKARDFHVKSGPLSFKASLAPQAEYAVDEYDTFDEEKGLKGISSSNKNSVSDDGLEISKLGISKEIVTALESRGITRLFPIQRAVLEPAMQGRDMIGRARTGTGKTLAFGIPILDRIIQFNAKHGRGRNPLCLVLAPTRELARQVEKEFRDSAPSLDTICVYGGTPIGRQMRELDYGVDIAVGTPGRIIDLLKRGALNLSEVQFVVLDEADQMLQVGFAEDVETILQRLPQNRQSMMFSATMPNWIRSLTQKYLKNPLTIDLVGDSDQKLADGISLYSIGSDMYGKASIIGPLITEHAKGGKCIVFTQTKRDADQLACAMARSFKCEALHGDISQSQRERTLSGFRDGRFNILVATDVAARGLDIPNVDLIIHYEIPNSSETFVHRTGRTGRAGKKGSAILIYTQEQARAVRGIEREVGCKFTELPRISAADGSGDLFNQMGNGFRSGSYGGMRDNRYGDMGSGRYGGQENFRSGSYGGSRNPGFSRSGGSFSGKMDGTSSGRFASNINRSGNFSGRGYGRAGGFGDLGRSERSSGLGDFGSGRSGGGFGDFGSGRSSGFGNSGSGRSGGGFGDFGSGRSSGFGDSGSGRSGGFGDFNSAKSGGFSDNRSSRTSGGFGNSHSGSFEDSSMPGDKH